MTLIMIACFIPDVRYIMGKYLLMVNMLRQMTWIVLRIHFLVFGILSRKRKLHSWKIKMMQLLTVNANNFFPMRKR